MTTRVQEILDYITVNMEQIQYLQDYEQETAHIQETASISEEQKMRRQFQKSR